MANEELLEALTEQEKRLVLAARPFIEAGREAARHKRRTMDSDVTRESLSPKDVKEMIAAERKFEAAIANELGITELRDDYAILTQVVSARPKVPDALDRFCALRVAAIRNVSVIWPS